MSGPSFSAQFFFFALYQPFLQKLGEKDTLEKKVPNRVVGSGVEPHFLHFFCFFALF